MRDRELEEIAAKAAAHHSDGGMGFPNGGKINVYACSGKGPPEAREPSCGHQIISIDREPGVTPFLTRCQNCGGEARSAMYEVDQTLKPTHEWYRPDSLQSLDAVVADHVRNGGLLLREIEPAHEHRHSEWTRFIGDLSMVAFGPPPSGQHGVPTFGVSPDQCDDCGTARVWMACVAPSGHEVSIGMSIITAMLVSDTIRGAAQGLVPEETDQNQSRAQQALGDASAVLDSLKDMEFDEMMSTLGLAMALAIARTARGPTPPQPGWDTLAAQMISRHVADLLRLPEVING